MYVMLWRLKYQTRRKSDELMLRSTHIMEELDRLTLDFSSRSTSIGGSYINT